VTLSFEPGEFTAFLGPNGAGKSSLLRLFAGLLAPSGGKVLLAGKDLAAYSARERARLLAYVPQGVHFAFPLTARECVAQGRYAHGGWFGRLSRADLLRCDRALELCDALPLADRWLEELSGGERQRVLLASALAQDPGLLLLDEPTLSLDPGHQEGFFRVVRQLHRREGLTVLMATHELNLAAASADRVVLLSDGRVLADGTAEAVLTPSRLRRVFGVALQRVRVGKRRFQLLPAQLPEDRP
jgi:iron complex transport system ATP-binding protein